MAPSHGFAAASHRERAPPRPANGGFHATYDVLLTPALATLPPKLGWVDMTMDGVHEYWRRVAAAPIRRASAPGSPKLVPSLRILS
jgi:Asp-tRNA(Asn)/Glu-tRNA(Gln) amidotransferase A subunit family amidase